MTMPKRVPRFDHLGVKEDLSMLIAQGKSLSEIAEFFNISKKTDIDGRNSYMMNLPS